MLRRPSVSRVREGAADKAATQLVKVQPCQLSVSDMKRRHIPGWVTTRAMRGVKGPAARHPAGVAVGAAWGPSERRSPKVSRMTAASINGSPQKLLWGVFRPSNPFPVG